MCKPASYNSPNTSEIYDKMLSLKRRENIRQNAILKEERNAFSKITYPPLKSMMKEYLHWICLAHDKQTNKI